MMPTQFMLVVPLTLVFAANAFAADGASRPRTGSTIQRADYPRESIRLGEEGVVIVNVYVTAEGTVGDVQLISSSGHKRLDEASLKMIRERFRYTPARDTNGNPIAAWTQARLSWELQ